MKPQEVKGNNGTAKINANGDVEVAWFCGGVRTFKPDHLRETIDLVDTFAAENNDVWLSLADSGARRFAVRLSGGKLYVVDTAVARTDEELERTDNVSWRTMKTSLGRALRGGEKP